MFAQKGNLKSGTNWVASWGSVQNVGWTSCQYVLMSFLQMVFGQWHGGVLSKIQLGSHMKGDQRKGLKKHSRKLQLLCSWITYDPSYNNLSSTTLWQDARYSMQVGCG
jgi:hypothetical protein